MTECTTQGKKKVRQSNMEMLRIISMLMILGTHADYYDISNPWVRFMIDSVNNVGSDCFVLISGWFGIHPNKRGLLNFLFIIVFYLILSYVCQLATEEQPLAFSAIYECVFRNPGWFVIAYLGLYVLAPVLNNFVERCDKKICIYFILGWFLYTFFFGWRVDYIHVERGYTCFSFILLYIIARYANQHKPKWSTLSYKWDFLLFLIFCSITSLLLVISEKSGHILGGEYYFRAYNSPLVIVSSIALLLCFTRFKFQSSVVNFFARSAFAVYMIHSSMFLYDKYRGFCTSLFLQYSDTYAIVFTLFTVIVVYMLCVIVDQLRLLVWHQIARRIL